MVVFVFVFDIAVHTIAFPRDEREREMLQTRTDGSGRADNCQKKVLFDRRKLYYIPSGFRWREEAGSFEDQANANPGSGHFFLLFARSIGSFFFSFSFSFHDVATHFHHDR